MNARGRRLRHVDADRGTWSIAHRLQQTNPSRWDEFACPVTQSSWSTPSMTRSSGLGRSTQGTRSDVRIPVADHHEHGASVAVIPLSSAG